MYKLIYELIYELSGVMICVQYFTFNAFQEHTYVVYDAVTKACMVVDPGCETPEEAQIIQDFIAQKGLQVVYLVNTHAHIDHMVGNYAMQQAYQVPLAIPKEDATLFALAATHAPQYGFHHYQPARVDQLLTTADAFKVGQTTFEVLFVPGHSPGHIALYDATAGVCFSGDVLFRGSIGRTDLMGGSLPTLLQSIQQQLLPLGDHVKIYPGHGPITTIGEEKVHNPHLAAMEV